MEGATEAFASARDTSTGAGPAGGPAADHAALRIAVAGTGFIGAVHAHAARRAGAQLVGVAASSASSAREAAQAFGADRGFADAESLVTAPNIAHLRTATQWPADGPVIRLHIGLEDADDLIADLEQAFARMMHAA